MAALLDAVRRHNEEGKEPPAKKPRAANAKAPPKGKGRGTAPGTLSSTHYKGSLSLTTITHQLVRLSAVSPRARSLK